MDTHNDQSFVGDTIELDGTEYNRCRFTKCTFRYRGGRPVNLPNCAIEDSKLELIDSAANTAMVLNRLRHTGLRDEVHRYLGLELEASHG
jgi:hypothetical protein